MVAAVVCEWMDALVPELDFQTILFDYDDVEAEKEAELRRLCPCHAGLPSRGGRVEQGLRFFGQGSVPVLSIEVGGLEWRLRRHLSSGAGPFEPESHAR